MLRMPLLLLFLIFSFGQAGCYAQEVKNTLDNLKAIDKYTYDFGRVKQGKVLKHHFILKNDSKNILNIKDVTTSCGCTVSKVKKKTLSPGEATSIEVRFNTKGYSGPIKQYIYVHTDRLDNPVIRFIIKADIVK